jgi:hypothetical protein
MAQPDYNNPYQGEIIGLDRQRKLAEMLLKQGEMQNMEGQMVSGRYVGASPWQGIANLYSIYQGKKLAEEADTKQQAIADKLRNLGQEEISNIMATAKGRQASQEQIAGPYDPSQGIKAPTIQYPEIKANQDAALTMAAGARTPEARAFSPALMANVLPKEGEIEQEHKRAVQRGEFKGTLLEYRRKLENLKDIQPSYSPFEATGGVFSMNSKTGQVTQVRDPVTGEPLIGKSSEPQKFKDTRYTLNQLRDATQDYMKDLKDTDVTRLNPLSQKAADLQTKFTNVQMQVKGLYELGAITGPDLQLLNQAITNPNSIMGRVRGGETLAGQVKIMDDIIRRSEKNLYKTYNLPVPSNLQDMPPAGQPNPAAAPAAPAAPVQRAYMGSEPIIVKNGVWVYEKTGKAVQ